MIDAPGDRVSDPILVVDPVCRSLARAVPDMTTISEAFVMPHRPVTAAYGIIIRRGGSHAHVLSRDHRAARSPSGARRGTRSRRPGGRWAALPIGSACAPARRASERSVRAAPALGRSLPDAPVARRTRGGEVGRTGA